jgi:hypothetical protein
VRTCARRNEFLLDLVVNSGEPLLGPLGASLESVTLCLQVFDPILGGAQLHPKLMRHVHSAFALLVRQIGCLLEQCNNCLSRLFQRITFIGRRFFLGCKLHDLLGYARAHVSLPTVDFSVKHHGSSKDFAIGLIAIIAAGMFYLTYSLWTHTS